jgi:hypothetical protein
MSSHSTSSQAAGASSSTATPHDRPDIASADATATDAAPAIGPASSVEQQTSASHNKLEDLTSALEYLSVKSSVPHDAPPLVRFFYGDLKRHLLHFMQRPDAVQLGRSSKHLTAEAMKMEDWPLAMSSLIVPGITKLRALLSTAHGRQLKRLQLLLLVDLEVWVRSSYPPAPAIRMDQLSTFYLNLYNGVAVADFRPTSTLAILLHGFLTRLLTRWRPTLHGFVLVGTAVTLTHWMMKVDMISGVFDRLDVICLHIFGDASHSITRLMEALDMWMKVAFLPKLRKVQIRLHSAYPTRSTASDVQHIKEQTRALEDKFHTPTRAEAGITLQVKIGRAKKPARK